MIGPGGGKVKISNGVIYFFFSFLYWYYLINYITKLLNNKRKKNPTLKKKKKIYITKLHEKVIVLQLNWHFLIFLKEIFTFQIKTISIKNTFFTISRYDIYIILRNWSVRIIVVVLLSSHINIVIWFIQSIWWYFGRRDLCKNFIDNYATYSQWYW